jgi:hypothetical protein
VLTVTIKPVDLNTGGAQMKMGKAINLAVVSAILAAMVFVGPELVSARDRRLSQRSEPSKKFDVAELLSLLKNRHPERKRDVIPAPNGNTGINGSGLPKPMKKRKQRPGRVIPAPNGNTGINGTGLPR